MELYQFVSEEKLAYSKYNEINLSIYFFYGDFPFFCVANVGSAKVVIKLYL